MKYFINSTADYHQHELNSLGWELTVCNALEPADSPCRSLLATPSSFGHNLSLFLNNIFPFDKIRTVLEIGGGMGYLMRDFLTFNPKMKAKMIDISPYLLNRQKEVLKSFDVDFELADILTVPASALSGFDLAIMNENLGDLPTLVASSEKESRPSENNDGIQEKIKELNTKYGLALGADENENINIGALETVEKLCLAGVRHIYLSEHSCEAVVSENVRPYMSFTSPGIPERISLKGHSEFTIKFSYLQKIAEMLNYSTRRGSFADFLPLNLSDRVKTALRLQTPHKDEQEIIKQFVYDLFKYEYLILIQGDRT